MKISIHTLFPPSAVLLLSALLSGFSSPALGQEQERPVNPNIALAKQKAKELGAYVNERLRIFVVPPQGFKALPEDEVREIALARRKMGKTYEQEGDKVEDIPVYQVIFRPEEEFDPSMREIAITAGKPPITSLEEFEKLATPEDSSFITHSRETLNVGGRECYLLDREFQFQGISFRHYCAYVQDYVPGGYLLSYQCAASDFDLNQAPFKKSLMSFKVIPPPMPKPGSTDAGPGQPPAAEGKPVWRSVPVLCSLLFVAAFVIWFIVKRLSAGAAAEGKDPDAPPEG